MLPMLKEILVSCCCVLLMQNEHERLANKLHKAPLQAQGLYCELYIIFIYSPNIQEALN